MGKTLLSRLKDGVKRGILIGAAMASIGFSGCQQPNNPEINYPPTVKISTPTNYFKLGDKVPLTFTWEDKNGSADIFNYKAGIDKNADGKLESDEEIFSSSTAVNSYSWTPSSAGTFKWIARVTDKEGFTGQDIYEIVVQDPANPANYPPTVKISSPTSVRIGQSVPLTFIWNDPEGINDITNYKAWIDKNLNGQIDAGEEVFSSPTIINNYSWTPSSAGTFKWIAQATDKANLTGKDSLEITVLDLPKVNLTPTDLIEGKSITINLPAMSSNTNEAISYTNATVNGNAAAKLEGNNLTLTVGSISQDSPYNITLNFKNSSGDTNTATLNGTIKNLCEISGQLQDTATHTNQAGTIKIYDASNNSLLKTESSNGNSRGNNFTISASAPASQIKLRGQFGTYPNDSFIRTITLDGTKDYSNVLVRAKEWDSSRPYSKTDFINFIRQINFETPDLGSYGLKRWDLNQLKGIEILAVNPINNTQFSNKNFTNPSISDQQFIANKVKDAEDIGRYIRGKTDEVVQIDGTNPIKHYIIEGNGQYITPNEGWIVILPDNPNSINTSGQTRPTVDYSSGKTTGVWIKIRTDAVNNNVVSHEFGHAFIAPVGEANSTTNAINSSYSIMWSGEGNLTKPGIADKDAGEVIYEDSYLPKEKLDDILG